MNGAFEFKGFEEWLDRVQQAGVDIDESTARAVDAGASVALTGMRQRVRKRSHRLENHIQKSDVERSGNNFSVKVGLLDLGRPGARYGAPRIRKRISRRRNKVYPREFLYGVVQEFGSAKMRAQPYIRPTFDSDRSKIRQAEIESLKRDGMV